MKNRLKFCLVMVLFLSSTLTFAQQTVISGKVTDQSGELLPGVTVVIKGTTQGSVTDMDGNYMLSKVSAESVLVFSFVGMTAQELTVGSQTTLNVTMIADAIGIDEVVAIGYGTQKRSSLTGAVAKLKNENLDKMPVSSVQQAMIGQLAGVSIRQSSSSPGDDPQIIIRGTSSITGSNDPLIVVDGFPIEGGLSSINSGDIESIEILKDASSAAIYGSRAAGGVIIVTTKKGDNQKASFGFNAYYGVKNAINLYDDILNSEEAYQYSLKRLDVEWEQDGGDPDVPVSDRPIDYQPNEEKRDFADTDWQDEVLKTGMIQNYELTARGGNKFLNYYVSGNYMSDEGVKIVGAFKRYSVRVNLTTSFSDKLELGLNFYSARTDQERSTNVLNQAIKYPSYIPVYLPEGETTKGGIYAPNKYYFGDGTNTVNPVAKTKGTINNVNKFRATTNSYLSYKIIDGLTIKTSLGINYLNSKNPQFRYTWGHKDGQTTASWRFSEYYNYLNENILTYIKTFDDKHDVNALLGASYQKQETNTASIGLMDGTIPDNRIHTLNVGTISEGQTFETEWGLISYFGRINYSFDNKYLVSAAYRMDGSSKFGKDRKWGTFPSLSLGWRVEQEEFMQSVSQISSLKLRASYGLTGRTPEGLYDPIARVQNFNYTLGSGNGTLVNGATQGTFGNTELGWEKTKEFNIGLDLGLFNNRISLMTDLYQRYTTNLLLSNPIPATTGFSETTTNIGEISNKGIELSLHTRNLTGRFKWDTKINFSRNINEVVDLGGLESMALRTHKKGMSFQTKIGSPIGQYFGWVQEGVWKSQEEIDANPSFNGAKPGGIRVKDMNGDGEIDADDRAVLGNYMPDFEFGITNQFSYKNFDLSFLINGVIGFEIYNYELQYYNNSRKMFTENRWFSPNELGDGKTIGVTKGGANTGSTDYFIEDGSYWGMRNLTFGYTFPEQFANKVFNSARIYLSVQNAFFITSNDFHAYNPEGLTEAYGDLTMQGVNLGSNPLNRTVSIGVNLNF